MIDSEIYLITVMHHYVVPLPCLAAEGLSSIPSTLMAFVASFVFGILNFVDSIIDWYL